MKQFFIISSIIYFCLINGLDSENLIKCIEMKAADNMIILRQKDFESGTYRIKDSGYYKLDESIFFNPKESIEKKRSDKPFIGWFAAISVETDTSVVIDLNGYTLQAEQEFIDKHIFNVFADIELDNCPFSGKLFGFPDYKDGFANFKGDTYFNAAKNVVIKNGTLSRSGHWGIHGNNNENIFVHDLVVKDWEVRGVELIGLKNGCIKDVEISGLEHTINTSVPLVGALQVKYLLEKLLTYGVYQAESQHRKLVDFLESNPGYLNPPQTIATGTIGGIFLTGAGVSNVGFPVTNQMCSQAAAITDGGIAHDVEIENVYVHDILVNSIQYVSIGSNQIGPDGNIIRLEGVGILPGASLFWHDAYDKNGNFSPNEILRSLVLVARTMIHYKPELKKTVPKNFLSIVDSILTNDHETFIKNVTPVFTYPSHKIKGLFGIRIEGAHNISVKNCKVENLKSVGNPCQELSEIFDAKYFIKGRHAVNADGEDPTYRGNDIWAYECAASKNCIFIGCSAKNIESYYGNPFGFELITDVQDSHLIDCYAESIIGGSDIIDSHLNLPSESYGFRVQRTDQANRFINCTASNVTAPRRSFGFAAEACSGALFKKCSAQDIYSSSVIDIYDEIRQKVAYGFNAEAADATSFLECSISDVRNANEQIISCPTQSIAAGIAVTQNSKDCIINECFVSDIYSGCGKAAGLYIEGELTVAHSNNTISNIVKDSESGYAAPQIIG